ncbi:MAG: GNAT family N-acetyltransferase [Pseudomonadota bacterium]|jgi:ribosomal protein S18 acetylase RimI-like enzyme|uniref:Histone acetyltransferase HPA2 and related acetyltransferases n=1 Tax=hydrothermal vent metagenome TaxID=652676 RepID=A0A160TMZ8_9ZZZZ
MSDITIRLAVRDDLPRLHAVIERAYRGDSARAGWTHEADLLDGTRTDIATLEASLANPAERLLVALNGDAPIGCVQVTDRGDGLAYLGLLCIEPTLQTAGLGKRLIDAAETLARGTFGTSAMEMTVIENRVELIAYYERRGYVRTGERRDFPVAVIPPFYMTVLVKPLA